MGKVVGSARRRGAGALNIGVGASLASVDFPFDLIEWNGVCSCF
jgi:hypothetical protein